MMEYVVVKLVAVLCTVVVCYAANSGTLGDWGIFTEKYKIRNYTSDDDERSHEDAFWKNDLYIYDTIETWYKKESHFVLYNNMFSDMTDEEWAEIDQEYVPPDDDDWGRKPAWDSNDPDWDKKQKAYTEKFAFVNTSWTSIKATPYQIVNDVKIPARLDWRKRMVVPKFDAVCCVIDCRYGSYAWAVAVTLFSHLNIMRLEAERHRPFPRDGKKEFKPTPSVFSMQQLMDCLGADDVFYDKLNICEYHVNGGNGLPDSVVRAFKHAILNGLEPDSTYNYNRGKYQECRYSKERAESTYNPFTGYVEIGKFDEVGLAQALAFYGPLTVSFNPNMKEYWLYRDGVFTPEGCKGGKTVSMVLVGYGKEKGQRYWLLMSPWGERWGRDGFMKMRWFGNKGCNIAAQAIFPTWPDRENITFYDFEYWDHIESKLSKYTYPLEDVNRREP
ncbi:hypothetical protein GE061_007460 [Apolygus lucorum]|uniref:Peptidase C1A papain C-terminal domain-containing protein n=1 Tax=Apolygus lucorum TaxID=248454 RepID=A0A8S9WT98_APOLU|nr:hypothetical protein GE061_007460 [Apolygus lucorum]